MKKYIITTTALVAVLTSCSPSRHLATSNNIKDSVRVETVIRTEYIPDTVFIEIPIERERQTVRDTTSHLETSFALSDARINEDGTLYHSLENKPHKRPTEIQKEVVYRDSIVYRDRTGEVEKVVEVERELTWWQKMKMKGFWLLLVVFGFVFRKKILPVVKFFM